MTRNTAALSLLIFCVVFLAFLFLHGHKLILTTNDEGVFLEGAERVVQGQKLYVDFFGVMSPGAYISHAIAFQIAGINLLAGRLPVLVYFALQCALVFWLTEKISSRTAAWCAMALFLVLQSGDLAFLTAQHRWDSGAISLVSIALAVQGQFDNRRRWWMAAGAAIVLAAFFTPSMALVAAVTVAWLVIQKSLRRFLAPYLIGGTIVCAVSVGAMAATGVLVPFIGQMRWISSNYSGVNVMPYGAIIGGYRHALEGPLDATALFRVLVVLCLAWPAIMPLIDVAGWAAALKWKPGVIPNRETRHAIIYLVICCVALVSTTYPRPDVMHLAYVAAVPYAVTMALIYWYVPKSALPVPVIASVLGAMLFGLHMVGSLLHNVDVDTPVGRLHAEAADAASVTQLLAVVKPGDTMYVHPYKPLLYFLTQSANPTRYPYLAPGMMNDADEQAVLSDLQKKPPEWILFLDVPLEEFQRVFPNGDPARLKYRAIEAWMAQNYHPAQPPVDVTGYRLLRRGDVRLQPSSAR